MTQAGKESLCLGLIGGLGLAATVFYYRELVSAIERQGRVPRLLIAHRRYQARLRDRDKQ
jgi:aspartate/glutamate racemase